MGGQQVSCRVHKVRNCLMRDLASLGPFIEAPLLRKPKPKPPENIGAPAYMLRPDICLRLSQLK